MLVAHTEMGQMRRGGFDSINVLRKWQRGFRERALIRVKRCQVTTTKGCIVGKFLENRVSGRNHGFVALREKILIAFQSHLVLTK